ncbi:hypothetical protein QAD02_015290 [Eretmocerus hayati]|uniref:Uncharacterized protein n=1 Tax=Eretmocerus hayati TaxID=131215 RepID=A0ACC2P8T3_9HYME|nr:hypothetical protein QAD02_015290 [Eretmocerus hayati]
MESGTLAKVLNDFFTTVDGELSLNKGEFFLVHKVIDKHWCYGQSHKQIGKFPTNRLLKVDLPEINDNESLFVSIATFKGEQPGDLSFGQGELIIGNVETSSAWLTGHIGPREGIFPASYVWQVDSTVLKKVQQNRKVRKKAKVKANLSAQLPEELDLLEGEIVTVVEVLEDGWCRGHKENGKEGIFPEGFIVYQADLNNDEVDTTIMNHSNQPIMDNNYQGQAASADRIYKDFGESYSNDDHLRYEDPAPNYEDLFPDSASGIDSPTDYHPLDLKPYAITLYPFKAQFPNELSFETGEVVELIKYIDNEWAEGIIKGTKGIFPISYANIIINLPEVSDDSSQEDSSQTQDDLQPGNQVKVEYRFDPQMKGDLSVAEGEIVTVVEMPNADWVMVKNEKNETGLCPRTYLTKDFDVEDEIFHDAIEDAVELRNEDKDENVRETDKSKRLSEPHRPAPPAPSPGRIPLQKQTSQIEPIREECNDGTLVRKKKADQRQNVITELYLTEKDYIRDLKMTYETFNLHNPSFLESKGVDVTTLFCNISEITAVAEELLELIQRAMKGCDEDYQSVGPCFLKMAEKMRVAYGRYCNNHESSLALLQKYEDNREIMKIFEKGVETLRMQVACFDMNSVLIKPVQRILKYPLILNELTKCTADDHPDKPKIEEASKVMADVASYINEYKRKKELASKYLHSNNTLIGKMANLNMHSVAKKSSRFSAKVSATLGLTNLPVDTKFDELVKDFSSLEKSTKQFLKDVEQCIYCLDGETLCGDVLIEQLHQYFTGARSDEIMRLQEIRSLMRTKFIKDLQSCVERRMPEDLTTAKNNYEALNQQLLEELPVFIEASTAILYNCIGAFTNARKLYNAKIMKRYLLISDVVSEVTIGDILDSFLVHHNLLYNQISRLSYGGTNSRMEGNAPDYCLQSEVHRRAVIANYPPNKLYVATKSVSGGTPLDLSVTRGTIVGVIKTQNPMGDTSKWFVDSGAMKGFMESQYLEPSVEAKLIEETARAVTPDNSGDLMLLDSPVKEASKRYSADLHSLSSDTSDEQNDNPPNYESIVDSKPETRQLYENFPDQFVYAIFDFHEPGLPGTLSITEGQALKVLMKHDQKNNPQWWLVENRSGGKGYVPYNYVSDQKKLNH